MEELARPQSAQGLKRGPRDIQRAIAHQTISSVLIGGAQGSISQYGHKQSNNTYKMNTVAGSRYQLHWPPSKNMTLNNPTGHIPHQCIIKRHGNATTSCCGSFSAAMGFMNYVACHLFIRPSADSIKSTSLFDEIAFNYE